MSDTLFDEKGRAIGGRVNPSLVYGIGENDCLHRQHELYRVLNIMNLELKLKNIADGSIMLDDYLPEQPQLTEEQKAK